MQYDPDDTIAAIGTPTGGAPRGMIRLSGPQVVDCLEACFRSNAASDCWREVNSPCVVAGSITLEGDKQACLPCSLFFWPNDRSYTRQPTAELHTLGSPPLLEKLLAKVCRCGARLAEPGEFTLRAFLAGRLDLTQAEAVLGVIDAKNNEQLHSERAKLAGGLSTPLSNLREQLLQLLSELEAGLDFVEEDIEFISANQLRAQLTSAQTVVESVLTQLDCRDDASDLPRVVLVGPPNAGKSSLFNALVERHAAAHVDAQALVSSQSGTTRDFVTATADIDGLACQLIDTAGVESTADRHSIDQIAQEMANQQHNQADLLIRCEPASTQLQQPSCGREIVARTKSDLLDSLPQHEDAQIVCSSIDGSGLDRLAQLIFERLSDVANDTQGSAAITATRCAESLRQAQQALTRARQIAENQCAEELIAAEVRSALHSLGQVVGEVYTDDILDRIFGQFCIGK
ncbi:MAG: tRNA modification GTPase [Bythopirellula sp.]